MRKTILTLATAATLTACAQSPEAVAPAYVSAVPYQSWSCRQLGEEAHRLSAALASAGQTQQNARTGDAVGIILIGLPLSSMSGQNVAPQIARLKGEMDAVRQASIRKNCGHDISEVIFTPTPSTGQRQAERSGDR